MILPIEIHEPIIPNSETLKEIIAMFRGIANDMEAHPDNYTAVDYGITSQHINWKQQMIAYDSGEIYPDKLNHEVLNAEWNRSGESLKIFTITEQR